MIYSIVNIRENKEELTLNQKQLELVIKGLRIQLNEKIHNPEFNTAVTASMLLKQLEKLVDNKAI
jgi:hypothetical protein